MKEAGVWKYGQVYDRPYPNLFTVLYYAGSRFLSGGAADPGDTGLRKDTRGSTLLSAGCRADVSGVQILHDPHGNCEGSSLLYVRIRDHLGFRGIGEEADLGNHCRYTVVPQEIIIRICFDLSCIILSGEMQRLRLDQGRQTLTFRIAGRVEDLRAVLAAVRITVLVDAYGAVRFGFCDESFPVLQIACFFAGRAGIFQTAVRIPGENHTDAVLFQYLLAFEGNGEIDLFFFNAGGADLSGVFSAVGRMYAAPESPRDRRKDFIMAVWLAPVGKVSPAAIQIPEWRRSRSLRFVS